jgi:hypothetical protein
MVVFGTDFYYISNLAQGLKHVGSTHRCALLPLAKSSISICSPREHMVNICHSNGKAIRTAHFGDSTLRIILPHQVLNKCWHFHFIDSSSESKLPAHVASERVYKSVLCENDRVRVTTTYLVDIIHSLENTGSGS